MATMLGKDPEDAPQPDLPEDEAAQSSVFEFTWQDLRSCTRYINDKGWSQAPIPAILEIVPENIVVSRQLQQILLWSLQRFDETPPQDQQRDVGQPDGASEPSSSGRTSMPSGENTVPAASKADGSEESEEPATPSRMEKRKSVSLMTRLKQLRQDVANKRSSVDGSGARTGSTRPPAQQVSPNGECISCFDEFPRAELVHLTCSHDYCKSCLREVVLNAMKNESLFPPKCCLTEMPLKTVLVCLENKQREEYKEKSAEYAVCHSCFPTFHACSLTRSRRSLPATAGTALSPRAANGSGLKDSIATVANAKRVPFARLASAVRVVASPTMRTKTVLKILAWSQPSKLPSLKVGGVAIAAVLWSSSPLDAGTSPVVVVQNFAMYVMLDGGRVIAPKQIRRDGSGN